MSKILLCKQLRFLDKISQDVYSFSQMANTSKPLVLTVVRHGETASNKERRMQGQINTKLNETGIKQATLAGKVLKETRFDRAYSSDLDRAKTTCQLIMEQNDASSVENIIEDSRIRERSFGEFENKLVSEFENKAKEAGFKRWIDFSPENGETREVVRERAREFFNDVVEQNAKLDQEENPSILMVTHGGLIRELFQIIFDEMGCDLPSGAQPGDHKKLAKNTSWSRFELSLSTDHKIEIMKCFTLCNADHLDELNK